MSDCDNNCEAVADLHDASVNLIGYSKQIDKWVNGAQNETVIIGGVNTPTLRNLAMAIKQLVGVYPDDITIKIDADKKIRVNIKQNGGIKYDNNGLYIALSNSGLAIDEAGNLVVDLSNMPTDKFEMMIDDFRRSLRLQKWLTKNTVFYVDKNHEAAADTLIDGRGLSPDLPFATINACAAYVAENFNLGKFNAYIVVAAGTYDESVTLPAYTATTGLMFLQGDGATQGVLKTIIQRTNASCLYVAGGHWVIQNLKFVETFTSAVPRFSSVFGIAAAASAHLDWFELEATYQAGVPANAQTRPMAIYGGLIWRSTTNNGPSKITINGYTQGMDTLIRCDVDTNIQMVGASSAYPNIICAGGCSVFMGLLGGSFSRNTGYSLVLGFSGPSFTGKRFSVANGAHCSVNGLGPDYFPGNVAGTVDSATYSWYI